MSVESSQEYVSDHLELIGGIKLWRIFGFGLRAEPGRARMRGRLGFWKKQNGIDS